MCCRLGWTRLYITDRQAHFALTLKKPGHSVGRQRVLEPLPFNFCSRDAYKPNRIWSCQNPFLTGAVVAAQLDVRDATMKLRELIRGILTDPSPPHTSSVAVGATAAGHE